MKTKSDRSRNRNYSYLGAGIALGAAFGAAFGNLALGIALGTAFGVVIDESYKPGRVVPPANFEQSANPESPPSDATPSD